jgi:hypothetical protein
MRQDLLKAYIPSCVDCQCNKDTTSKPTDPLHPLPIPDQRGDSIAIDFIGPLPIDDGFDSIVTITNRLGSDICIAATHTNITTEHFAAQFFNVWYCENSLPLNIISDHDKIFVSKFWKVLHVLTGVKLKVSSVYHPETDGSSEWSNKTEQVLCYHVDCYQKG